MNRYNNGKIYKLVNSVNDKFYVGSTAMPLTKRLSSHKAVARYKPERRVYEELNTVGWTNVRIIQIEEFKCETKNELVAREQHFIDLLKPELNKASAIGRCIHDRRRTACKDCGGGSICEHNKQRNHCKVCNPTTCELCGITTSKGDFNKHITSNKHLGRITT
jgi:group I intron endonuclease